MKIKLMLLAVVCGLVMSQTLAAQEMTVQATEAHKVLKNDVGTWEAEMKMWMPGQSEPIMAKGQEVNTMLGDFWIVSNFSGELMGQEFHGHGTFGYDPASEKYVGTWIDSMSPYMSKMEGTYDKSTKTMTMMMKGRNPDGSPNQGKNVTVTKDENTRVFTMYMSMPGSDEMAKGMEITYRRK